MNEAVLTMALGSLCLAAAIVYGTTLLIENRASLQKAPKRFRLAVHRLAASGRLPRWLPAAWFVLRPEVDPVAIGRHASQIEGYDEAHAARIADICRMLSGSVGLAREVAASLLEAAHLHDAGIEDWDVALGEPGPLSELARARLAEHCARGEYLARDLCPDPMVAQWVRWHHERFDGSGYPDGLEGDEIPLPAQILGLADTFEAMTHARPYRPAMAPTEALWELQRLAGLRFSPELVEGFVRDVYPILADRRGGMALKP